MPMSYTRIILRLDGSGTKRSDLYEYRNVPDPSRMLRLTGVEQEARKESWWQRMHGWQYDCRQTTGSGY
jgi:hypothetical protein